MVACDVIPTFERCRQEDHKFTVILGYIVASRIVYLRKETELINNNKRPLT